MCGVGYRRAMDGDRGPVSPLFGEGKPVADEIIRRGGHQNLLACGRPQKGGVEVPLEEGAGVDGVGGFPGYSPPTPTLPHKGGGGFRELRRQDRPVSSGGQLTDRDLISRGAIMGKSGPVRGEEPAWPAAPG